MRSSGQERAELQRAMTALAAGDRDAFEPVFALTWPVLRRIAERMLDDPIEAEDAAQRALLKLFAHAARFDPDRDALPWAVTFVLNECRTIRNRKRRRGDAAPLPIDPQGHEPTPEEALQRAELHRVLESVLGTLSEADRIALGLVADPEPAEAVAPATLRKRKQRALQRLRFVWRRMHGIA